jgi:hypothetical protein
MMSVETPTLRSLVQCLWFEAVVIEAQLALEFTVAPMLIILGSQRYFRFGTVIRVAAALNGRFEALWSHADATICALRSSRGSSARCSSSRWEGPSQNRPYQSDSRGQLAAAQSSACPHHALSEGPVPRTPSKRP